MRWIYLTSLVMLVATCGQKGPLSLPSKALPGDTQLKVMRLSYPRADNTRSGIIYTMQPAIEPDHARA